AQVFADVKKNRLASAPAHTVMRLWLAGPIDDKSKSRPAEQGVIDLTAEYDGPGGQIAWHELRLKNERFEIAPAPGHSYYAYFQLQSAARQPALLSLDAPGGGKLWHNGDLWWHGAAAPDPVALDLQPGSNDFLLRLPAGGAVSLELRAREPVEVVLPEKLSVATLAERLKAGR